MAQPSLEHTAVARSPAIAVGASAIEYHETVSNPRPTPLCIVGEELFSSSARQMMLSKLLISAASPHS